MKAFYIIDSHGAPLARISGQPSGWEPSRGQRLGLDAPFAFRRAHDTATGAYLPVNARNARISGSEATNRQALVRDCQDTAVWIRNQAMPYGGFWYAG